MTKEELEKEAEEYVTRTNNNDYTIEAYIAGAEPRENRIAELEKENTDLKARLNAIKMLTPELEKSSKLIKQQTHQSKRISQ